MDQQGREFIRTNLRLKTKNKSLELEGAVGGRGIGTAGLQLDLLAELVIDCRRRNGHALGTLAL